MVISFISELELLSFPKITPKSERVIKGILEACSIEGLNPEIKDLTIDLRRRYHLKLPDAIIAATAYFLKLPLVTSDKQFKKIEEIRIIIYEV